MPRLRSTAALRRLCALALGTAALASATVLSIAAPISATASSSEPNVVLILTDDQTLDEMAALPQTQALIGGQGVTFNRAYISYPLCCPSRVSILQRPVHAQPRRAGQRAPERRVEQVRDNGTEAKALPTWLQTAGYYNVEIGKYMNGYLGDETLPIPPGWDEWYGKLSEYDENLIGGSIYFNYRLREDPPLSRRRPVPGRRPDRPAGPALHLLLRLPARELPDRRRRGQGRQRDPAPQRARVAAEAVLHGVNFNAPHSPYVPAPRHDGAFAGGALQKVAGLNEKDVRDKPRFLRRLPKLGKGKLNQIADRRRARLRDAALGRRPGRARS